MAVNLLFLMTKTLEMWPDLFIHYTSDGVQKSCQPEEDKTQEQNYKPDLEL
ncbi:hypothetical protein BCU66_011350 [Vibrio sp. 10N.286.49.B1]|uniref:hypothetical protein n=1 Tax=unclassified Vibrio TaxID=2614977 RepID=UPI0013001632|nr:MULTISPECIES: hypothetical protein [unclassified Vibrio]